MSHTDKREMARRLRAEADSIRRHGLTNLFEHTYACLRYGQASKERAEERCGFCPLRPYVPAGWQQEAFPCQHINARGWDLTAQQATLAAQYVAWLVRTAAELEEEAAASEAQEVC